MKRTEIRNSNGSVILLLGAGASIEAKIPHTAMMIDLINKLLAEDDEWKMYRPVYEHLKKLYGNPNLDKNSGVITYGDLNIEELVSILDELLSLFDGRHPLYPFFKNWIDMFGNLYGFKDLKNFRDRIENKLKEWIVPPQYELDYYRHLLTFAKQNPGTGLRVFTLNYDRCVEESFIEFAQTDTNGLKLERGFGIENQGCTWHARNFEEKDDVEKPGEAGSQKHLFLYKMHGSIDWGRNAKQELTRINGQNIKELIFGTRMKVKAHDPYLYYVYQFRTFTLNAKLIIVCGYGFFDSHINDILHQALVSNNEKRVLICHYPNSSQKSMIADGNIEELKAQLISDYKSVSKLNLPADSDQVFIEFGSAKTFFEGCLNMEHLESLYPVDEEEGIFFDATDEEEPFSNQ